MNYTRIYASIVFRAQAERTERLALKKQGKYFENHHIVPRSLGGKDVQSNMALLTAREHFICHWLLVKMYPINTVEYSKMIFALWMMNANPIGNISRYKNSRCYEWIRIKATKLIGLQNKSEQAGIKNSQYGKHWYTNYETGESTSFIVAPNEKWILGRNLFRGENSKLNHNRNAIYKCSQTIENIKQQKQKYAQHIWDDFHTGSYNGIREYCRQHRLKIPTISRMLKKYVPMYNHIVQPKSHKFCSNNNLVGKYII